MNRGNIVTIADPGGQFSRKPRPAVIVQSDLFNDSHASITVCLITSHLTGLPLFRVPLEANDFTGLRCPSEIEIDKIQAVWSHRIGSVVGRAPDAALALIDQAIRRWLSP